MARMAGTNSPNGLLRYAVFRGTLAVKVEITGGTRMALTERHIRQAAEMGLSLYRFKEEDAKAEVRTLVLGSTGALPCVARTQVDRSDPLCERWYVEVLCYRVTHTPAAIDGLEMEDSLALYWHMVSSEAELAHLLGALED